VIVDARVVRARKWLLRQGLVDFGPTELEIERIAARHRAAVAEWIIAGLATAFVVVNLVATLATGRPPGRSAAGSWFLVTTAVYCCLAFGALVSFLVAAAGERRIARSLPGRMAHPAAIGPREVLGRKRIRACLAAYPGSLVLGGVMALTVDPDNRFAVVVFVIAVVLLSVVAGISLLTILRRPAVASDQRSLYIDDLLRSQDAWRAVGPYPLLLGLGVAPLSGSPWYPIMGVYYFAVIVLYARGGRNALP
jgi:hypothetical protein